jgi:hypothetical protein
MRHAGQEPFPTIYVDGKEGAAVSILVKRTKENLFFVFLISKTSS